MAEKNNMPETGKAPDKKNRFGFRFVWSLFMVFAYVGISYLVLFTPYLIRYNAENNPANDQNIVIRLILGIVLFVYGLFRGYRFYREWK